MEHCIGVAVRTGNRCGQEKDPLRTDELCQIHGRMRDEGRTVMTIRGPLQPAVPYVDVAPVVAPTGDAAPAVAPPVAAQYEAENDAPAGGADHTFRKMNAPTTAAPGEPVPGMALLAMPVPDPDLAGPPPAPPETVPPAPAGEGAGDPFAALDSLAAEREPETVATGPAPAAAPVQIWTPTNVRSYLETAAGPFNRIMARVDVEPLGQDAINTGSHALTPLFNHLGSKVDPNSPWGLAFMWFASEIAPRGLKAGFRMGRKGKHKAAAPMPTFEAPKDTGPELPEAGWEGAGSFQA